MRELKINEVAAVNGGLGTTQGLSDSISGAVVGSMLVMDWGATIGGANGGNGGGLLGVGSIAAGVGMLAGGAYGFVVGGAVGAVTGLSGFDEAFEAGLKALSDGSLLPDRKIFE